MRYYKLTDTNSQTHGSTLWGENVTHTAKGVGTEMCTSACIHVYDHPLKAVMFNPLHANFKDYLLWECRVRKVVADDGLKVGVKQCTTLRQIEPPVITTNQRVRFAILCALAVYSGPGFVLWANNWLSGKDRTIDAAYAAYAAAYAAIAAAYAAYAAASAAYAADAARYDAANAANAANAAKGLNLVRLIKRAIKEEGAK